MWYGKARKKLRICMVLVVATAIIVGLIYYFHDVRGKDYATEEHWCRI